MDGHLGEGEELLAKILQRCSEMINDIIHDQKTVMDIRNLTNINLLILRIVRGQIQLQLLG